MSSRYLRLGCRPVSHGFRLPPVRFSSTASPTPAATAAAASPAPTVPSVPIAPLGSSSGSSFGSTLKTLAGTILAVVVTGAGYFYYQDSRSYIHSAYMPLIRLLTSAEESHKFAIDVLQWPLRPKDMGVDDQSLSCELLGLPISNPIGVAAGFDKHGQAIDGLFDLGFGYVEVGSVTPEPQPGNPLPRFFRLPEDEAVINRYGFNSVGHKQALLNIRQRVFKFARSHPSLFPTPASPFDLPTSIPDSIPRSLVPGKILAINLGKNKSSIEASNEDYIKGVRTFGPWADILVINVSSPNTPGLRALQGKSLLAGLLKEVVQERDALEGNKKPKLLVKVAPDLDEKELSDVAGAVRESGIDGVIVGNTTIRRPETLLSENASQTGGLSGKPLKPFALQALKTLRSFLPPQVPIIGCGGITTGLDALEFADAGASTVQLYTSFGYEGVGLARKVKDEVTEKLQLMGKTWGDVVRRGGGEENLEELKKELETLVKNKRPAAEETKTPVLATVAKVEKRSEDLVVEAEKALSS